MSRRFFFQRRTRTLVNFVQVVNWTIIIGIKSIFSAPQSCQCRTRLVYRIAYFSTKTITTATVTLLNWYFLLGFLQYSVTAMNIISRFVSHTFCPLERRTSYFNITRSYDLWFVRVITIIWPACVVAWRTKRAFVEISSIVKGLDRVRLVYKFYLIKCI